MAIIACSRKTIHEEKTGIVEVGESRPYVLIDKIVFLTDHLNFVSGARNPPHPPPAVKASLPYLQATQGHQFASDAGQILQRLQPQWRQQLFPDGRFPFTKLVRLNRETRVDPPSRVMVPCHPPQGKDQLN